MVGIGPGAREDRTLRAEAAIAKSTHVVGYTRYIQSIADLTSGKEVISTGMMHEVERCRAALEFANKGAIVSMVCSGDSGVYGMAGLVLELWRAQGSKVQVEIIPGVTAANAAASRMGAPLMLDYATISLSDLLVPFDTIRKRLEAVAGADLVTALYNPASKTRKKQFEEAVSIFSRHRAVTTPVGIATAMGTIDEQIILTDLGHVLKQPIGMRSIVIIGNSASFCFENFFLNPRGYRL